MLSVIIGRFQTNQLHEGHLDLIRRAKAVGDILVLIGCTVATGTDKNPLNFEARKHLFDSHLSNSPIMPLHDMPSDKDWSDKIDSIIQVLGFSEAVIWGGRNNSIENYYSGKHEIRTIEQKGNHSATSIRNKIVKEPINCPNFRAGVIHHVGNRWPIVYSTVDIAIYKTMTVGVGWEAIRLTTSVLMGKKGNKFMFVGGFVDPADANLHWAACRELHEETGLTEFTVCDMNYLFSEKVNDARYIGTKDCIMTHFFCAESKDGNLPDESKILDKEFTEFKWMPTFRSSLNEIADAHKPLFLKFITIKS